MAFYYIMKTLPAEAQFIGIDAAHFFELVLDLRRT